MFPGRSSDSQALPTRRTSQALGPVSFWLSRLLTAAGQFRSLTGFPFHPPCRGTEESDHYILSTCKMQYYQLRAFCRFYTAGNTPRTPFRVGLPRSQRQILMSILDTCRHRLAACPSRADPEITVLLLLLQILTAGCTWGPLIPRLLEPLPGPAKVEPADRGMLPSPPWSDTPHPDLCPACCSVDNRCTPASCDDRFNFDILVSRARSNLAPVAA